MTTRLSRHFACRKCEWHIGEAVKQEKMLCDEEKTVKVFIHLGDRVNAGGGCEAAMTARIRCGRAKLRECGELLHGRRFHLRLKGAVYRSTILYGSEAWCLKESEMGMSQRTKV